MNITSTFVVLVLGIASVLALESKYIGVIQAKFLSTGVKCLTENPLSFTDIMSIRNKKLPDGDKPKCFVECLFKKLGIMDDMGKIAVQGAKETAMEVFKDSDNHMSKAEKFIESCESVNNADISDDGMKSCDRAKLAFTCFVENAPKFGLDVDFTQSS